LFLELDKCLAGGGHRENKGVDCCVVIVLMRGKVRVDCSCGSWRWRAMTLSYFGKSEKVSQPNEVCLRIARARGLRANCWKTKANV
jgi:hypothetical protein